MADIWPVYEGNRPTVGWPWARLPLSEAIALFELRQEDFVSDSDLPPRFETDSRTPLYAGFKHIVVEIGRNEARQAGWKAGFYRSRVPPNEAFGRLLQQALAAELGSDNIVRLEWRPTIDSQGGDALKITVVIPPSAVAALKRQGESMLRGLVKLRERLQDMRDERTPIVEYATEAELKRDGRR